MPTSLSSLSESYVPFHLIHEEVRFQLLTGDHSTDMIVSSPNPVNIKFISMKKPAVRLVISNTLAVAYVCKHR